METLFWISLIFIAYTYAGYPCLLFLWSKILPRRIDKREPSPAPVVSVVVAARNEEKTIARRVENLIAQEYPADRLEIVVASDGSRDRTNSIVAGFVERSRSEAASASAHSGRATAAVKLVPLEENAGKPGALNAGVAAARGEFIVFADTRQEFEPGAVRELIANFSDPSVGSVSGELMFREDSHTSIKAEMGLYWDMEKWIRRMEGRIHSVAGATGAIYAIRRSLFREVPAGTILDDVLVPMRIVCRGYRNVFDGAAIAWDVISKDLAEEKRRKVRTLLGNYQLLALEGDLLVPFRNPIFWQFVSHKVFRLLVPFFFIALAVAAAFADGILYRGTLVAIACVLALHVFHRYLLKVPILGRLAPIARTFVSLNYFALLAFFRFLSPRKGKVW